ncbi:LTA synthase family protein [Dokdonella sp.]|uniref:LTA synthase family protein n=1 Tax=Dokdonella sp. TaxID=2291710 RepID=UPI003527224B
MRSTPPSPGDPGSVRFCSHCRLVATLLLALVLALVLGLRADRVDTVVGAYTGCRECVRLPAMGHDAWLLAAALGLLAVAWLVRSALVQCSLRVAFAALVLVATVDVILFDLLTHRLYFADVIRFGGETEANWSVLRASLASPTGWLKLAATLVLLVLLVLACLPDRRRPHLAMWLGGLAMLSAVAAVGIQAITPVHYVHASLTRNVLEINVSQSSSRPFSREFIEREREKIKSLPEICENNPSPTRPNVIVVLAESLSAWHSKLLGGPADWTPRLDALARENHYFTHFYANGFTTSGAEVAIGSGLLPINPPNALEYTFDHYRTGSDSLPGMAAEADYQSLFLTPGDTGFLGVGEWLNSIGYTEVHGSEEPWYEGHERWQFNAVADEVFYNRIIDWLDTRDPVRPFVSVLLTVTSHPPFVNPRTRQIDPEGSFRYVDEQLGELHAALRQRGFFDNGLLIIMGDHRTMTPLHEAEYRQFGERAFARVPMIVIGNVQMPKVVEEAFQQTDLLPSLAWQFGVNWCRSPYAGSFLRSDPEPPELVFHARGDDRNRVDVYHGAGEDSAYLLDGDDSRWLGTPPADGDRVAAWINVKRDEAAQRARLGREAAATGK